MCVDKMLRDLGYRSYTEYLRSEHWRALRRRFFAKSWRVASMRERFGTTCCEFCGCTDRPVELHHRTYKRLGREKLTDLVLLCGDCHSTVHRTHRRNGGSIWGATKQVARQILGEALKY